jgi:hypothetical protein
MRNLHHAGRRNTRSASTFVSGLRRACRGGRATTRVWPIPSAGLPRSASGREHVALVLGDVRHSRAPLVRVHSECLTGDVFGSRRCDCGRQLKLSLYNESYQPANKVLLETPTVASQHAPSRGRARDRRGSEGHHSRRTARQPSPQTTSGVPPSRRTPATGIQGRARRRPQDQYPSAPRRVYPGRRHRTNGRQGDPARALPGEPGNGRNG